MRSILAVALAAIAAVPAIADEAGGLVLAYDRQAGVIVLQDLTVWELPEGLDVPTDLGAGDRVMFTYESAGEDGMTELSTLERLATALPGGADGGS